MRRFSAQRSALAAAVSIVAMLQLMRPVTVEAADDHDWHKHHIAGLAGATLKSSKTQPFIGLEYEYRFSERFGIGAYYEEVLDNIDLQAFGLLLTYHPDNHWKIFGGPAVERKIDDTKNKLLVKFAVGYDFHVGHWSHGPVIAVDFVEDYHQVGYLGWTLGYGF